MSGIAAGNGSRFMNAKNAEAAISGFLMLQSLLKSPPRDIYWGYMTTRAQALKIPYETAEDLVLVRLACLSRLQDASGYKDFAWILGRLRRLPEGCLLIHHFLADGIETRAFVLEFLPTCVANAKANGLIGLTLLLEVLVELLTNLKQAVQASKETASVMTLPVALWCWLLTFFLWDSEGLSCRHTVATYCGYRWFMVVPCGSFFFSSSFERSLRNMPLPSVFSISFLKDSRHSRKLFFHVFPSDFVTPIR